MNQIFYNKRDLIPISIVLFCLLVISSCSKEKDSQINNVIIFTDQQNFISNSYNNTGMQYIRIVIDTNIIDTFDISLTSSAQINQATWQSNGGGSILYNCQEQTVANAIYNLNLSVGRHTLIATWVYSTWSVNNFGYYQATQSVSLSTYTTFTIDAGNCTYIDLPAYQ